MTRGIVIAGAIACILGLATYGYFRSRDTAPTEQQRREYAMLEAQARNRWSGDLGLILDSGRCLTATDVPSPWVRVPHDPAFDRPQKITVAAPLAVLKLPNQQPRPGDPQFRHDRIEMVLLPQFEDSDAGWPVVRPLRVMRLHEEGSLVQDSSWQAGESGLQLYQRMYEGRAIPQSGWVVLHHDPRTQCDNGFQGLVPLGVTTCVVTDAEHGVSAWFRHNNIRSSDLPRAIEVARQLTTGMLVDCDLRPEPRRTASVT